MPCCSKNRQCKCIRSFKASPAWHFSAWCFSKEPRRFKHIWLNNYTQSSKEVKTSCAVRRGRGSRSLCHARHVLARGFVVPLRLAGNEVILKQVDYRTRSRHWEKQKRRQRSKGGLKSLKWKLGNNEREKEGKKTRQFRLPNESFNYQVCLQLKWEVSHTEFYECRTIPTAESEPERHNYQEL